MWPFKAKNKKTVKARDKPSTTTYYKPVAPTRADVTMWRNEAIYAAVSRISNTVASMPMHLYKDYEVQRKHPLERLIALEPNPNFSSFTFIQTIEAYRNTEGNAYVLIVPGALGAIKRLDILDPTRVRPQRHPDTGEIWYCITLDDATVHLLPGCQLIVLKYMSANGEIGVKPVTVLNGTLDYDQQVKELSLHQLDGVNQGIFLELPNSALDDDARGDLVDRFLDAYEKSGQRVVVLEGGLKATTFSQSPIDAQVLDTERIMRNRVATVYNIPPHLLGDYTDTSFSTAEQQMQEYLQLTIMPIVQQWEQELNRKLLTVADYKDGYRFRFDTDALSRADTVGMANKYQMSVRGGWMKPNDVRAREGLPPDDNGNELMTSRDLIPLHIAVKHPELLLQGVYSAGEGEQD